MLQKLYEKLLVFQMIEYVVMTEYVKSNLIQVSIRLIWYIVVFYRKFIPAQKIFKRH